MQVVYMLFINVTTTKEHTHTLVKHYIIALATIIYDVNL